MRQDETKINHYIADEGKIIIPKKREEGQTGTTSLWLGKFDTIENYEEVCVEPENIKVGENEYAIEEIE